MAEIAGLVLGTLPLVIWALEKYAEPFEFYNKYRITIETQRDNLVMQNLQLRATLAEIGLSDESTKEELVQCFQAKYPEIEDGPVSDQPLVIIEAVAASRGGCGTTP
jgi:hypothetical protein